MVALEEALSDTNENLPTCRREIVSEHIPAAEDFGESIVDRLY